MTSAAKIVAAFVEATRALPDEAAARLAGVRAETIRKWRRRPPRWIRARTTRCLEAHLAGEPPAPGPGQSLQRAFEPVLRRRAPAE